MRWLQGSLFTILPVLLGLGLLAQAWQLGAKIHDNRTIEALAGTEDRAVPLNARGEVLLARGRFLLFRDRIDETIPILDTLARRGDASTASKLTFDMANARVRRAFAAIERDDTDKAAAEIVLARNGYRDVLRQDPGAWNAKQNLDVASRLVRDFPKLAPNEDAEEPAPPSSDLWTELPAQPRGLP
ncbi:mxaK protein [Arboricoccus pini]|uniref:MxaK protein n=1 Tax=Arboricoccus pini TaxID=1963835 RepID=A0A212R0G9_9PROT|nr:hypothetical protein [Arboricoccus pini]SNB65505.1 mxaK protein [Arboricoccus pini]